MITIENVAIKGISTSVPSSKINNSNLATVYGEKETQKLISSIGVKFRHVVDSKTTTADLCFDAANNILTELNWDRESIGAIIFVSQTPEYQLPATACVLQSRLDLPNNVIAYDVNLGCSGYVYGLFLAATLSQSGIGRVLLLVGDTISKLVNPGDRSTELLFGDAGSATAIEFEQGQSLKFDLGTDGAGAGHIIAKTPKVQDGSIRGLNSAYLEMNGGEVFTFTLKRVPSLINNFLAELKLSSENIDACIYHQANHFMLKHLAKKSKFSAEQVPISITDYGNTSCASIPVTICSQNIPSKSNLLLVGFGVGLSWAVVFCNLSNTLCLPIREINCDS